MRLLGAILCVVALNASSLTAGAAGDNVLVATSRTEPSIAVDPLRPQTVVVGTNTDYDAPIGNTFPVGYYSSRDGGSTFAGGTVPIIAPYTTGADPSVAIARSGTVFFSYLAEAPSYCSGGPGAVLLSTSVDHGRSFRAPTTVDANSADDKPFIAVRSIPGKRASVAISWTRWLAHSSEIWVGQSSNGGDSFNRPRRLFASSKNNFGSVPLFGQDGSLYVFWSNFDQRPLGQTTPTHILMKVSRDGGAHFGAIHSVSPWFSGIPQMAQPGSMRSLTMPAAVGEKDGAIDVAWAQVSHSLGGGRVDADIELTRSRDGGKTWSAPRRINDSRRGDRFMPTMTALDDGSLAVAFYDRRRSPYDLDVEAVRVSYHGGFHQTANIRVNQSDAPIASIFYIKPGSTCFSPGRFFGDYIGAAGCAPNTACIVWADTQRRIQDETDIWFARMRLDGLYH